MDIYSEIKKIVADALKELEIDVSPLDVHVEHPEMAHGDFATNIALGFAKKLGKNPKEVATQIAEEIKKTNNPIIGDVSVAGPGFVNITLSKKFFLESNKAGLKKDFGSSKINSGKKIMIEYTNTNIFKEMHIGHMMCNTIGESISRILKNTGAEVKNSTYQGDVGLHIAKAIWGMKKEKDNIPSDGESVSAKTAFLGKIYALGSVAYEDDENAKKEIVEINKHIYAKDDSEINDLYEWGRKSSLAHFEEIYKKLDTKFDYYFFEGEVAEEGLSVVKEFLKKGVFEESDGAIIFPGEKYGLHTRVFVNSEGLPTYEAKDIGNTLNKYRKYKFDQNIIVTGNEQKGYFEVVFKALEKIDEDLSAKMVNLSHGMLRLPSGKMSSRKGNVLTGESLIDLVSDLVLKKMEGREIDENEKENIVNQIAIGAIRYSILRHTAGSDIIFDFEKSLSFEGSSGPYLQYSYTRAQSVLQKAKDAGISASLEKQLSEITVLERMLYRFPEITKKSAVDLSAHHIALYLTDLAGEFNAWYAKEKIVDEKDDFSPYKIAITEIFANTMKNGLHLIGIKVPSKM